MAHNVRGDLVIEPLHVAEYDRISSRAPLLVVVAGTALFLISVIATLSMPLDEFVSAPMTLLGTGALLASLLIAAKLGVANTIRRDEITRDIVLLRDVVVFDESTVSDENLWVAAGLANDLDTATVENERLSSALVRTAEQERQFAEFEQQRHELADRIFDIVCPPI